VNSLADQFALDPDVTFLNHGSFGACPRSVLEEQSRWRARLEAEPVRFFVTELEALLDGVRATVAELVGGDPEGLAFVPNATTAVNAVLGSLSFAPGDELLCTDHGYNAVANTLARTAERTGARVVTAQVPFPLASEDDVVESVLARVSERTKLLVIDHITSPTALVFPVARLVRELRERGIETLVDGAHAPGQVTLSLRELGAAYYTGNFHKWCCAPKSCAFLYVREELRERIKPVVTSHGRSVVREGRSRFLLEFDWTGTTDPTAILSVPRALEVLGHMLPGGLGEVMVNNHALARAARRTLAEALGLALPCPDAMLGSMAALRLPDAPFGAAHSGSPYPYALQQALVAGHGIQVPIMPWPAKPARLVRVSAQLYNHLGQYERLATALTGELARERTSG
jgi:isopenicillin-N epimerase